MTEDQAKTKWCPFVRWNVTRDGDNSFQRWNNRASGLDDDANGCCITSDCMAWCATDNEFGPTLPGMRSNPQPAGYCGLTMTKTGD